MRFVLLSVGGLGLCQAAAAQVSFSDGTSRLVNGSLSSGVAIGVVDMNGDGLDDIVRLDEATDLEIEFQQPDGSFVRYDYGPTSGELQWSMSIADVDRNGVRDIFVGGAYEGLQVLRGDAEGTSWSTTNLPDEVFTQCSSFADIDNNGTTDLFICHDDGRSVPLSNDGSGGFSQDLSMIDPSSTVPSNNSGNYGIVWTDYDSDGDLDMYLSKCRLGVDDPLDGRRLNMLFENDGQGNYTDVAEARGLRPGAQSWAADFADIDNDGDLDVFLINHDIPSQLYLNHGGTFTDITAGSGIAASDIAGGIQVLFEDFDNDGWVDLLVTALDGLHYLYKNDKDGTFTEQFGVFPTGGNTIQSASVGDIDDDGDLDVMAGFAEGYNYPQGISDRLFINETEGNNWLKVRLIGHASNIDGIGARIELLGGWGTQSREVRGGEGYGITRSLTRHFGLGTETGAASLVVHWPSGQVSTIEDPPINTTLVLDENCIDLDGDGVCQVADCDDQDALRAEDCTPPTPDPGPGEDDEGKTGGCSTGGAPAGLLGLPLLVLLGRRRSES